MFKFHKHRGSRTVTAALEYGVTFFTIRFVTKLLWKTWTVCNTPTLSKERIVSPADVTTHYVLVYRANRLGRREKILKNL